MPRSKGKNKKKTKSNDPKSKLNELIKTSNDFISCIQFLVGNSETLLNFIINSTAQNKFYSEYIKERWNKIIDKYKEILKVPLFASIDSNEKSDDVSDDNLNNYLEAVTASFDDNLVRHMRTLGTISHFYTHTVKPFLDELNFEDEHFFSSPDQAFYRTSAFFSQDLPNSLSFLSGVEAKEKNSLHDLNELLNKSGMVANSLEDYLRKLFILSAQITLKYSLRLAEIIPSLSDDDLKTKFEAINEKLINLSKEGNRNVELSTLELAIFNRKKAKQEIYEKKKPMSQECALLLTFLSKLLRALEQCKETYASDLTAGDRDQINRMRQQVLKCYVEIDYQVETPIDYPVKKKKIEDEILQEVKQLRTSFFSFGDPLPTEILAKELINIVTDTYNSAQTSKRLKNEEDIEALLSEQIPENFALGSALDRGDCFFDALVQRLGWLNTTNPYTAKSLRNLCHTFYSNNKEMVDGWNTKEFGGIDSGKDDYYMVQYTADECEKDFHGGSPIWGRPAIEGKILCQQLVLSAIVIIEILEDRETKQPISNFQLVTEEDCKTITDEEAQKWLADPYVPTLVVNDSHFVPLLPKVRESKITNGEKAEDFIQKILIKSVTEFFVRYISNTEFRFYKHNWKHWMVDTINTKFNELYELNYNDRQDKIITKHGFSWQYMVETIKKALRHYDQIHPSLISGRFGKGLRDCIDYLDRLSPSSSENKKEIYPTASEQLYPKKSSQSHNWGNGHIEDRTGKILLANLLRIVDYYCNNTKGQRIAADLGIEQNSSANNKWVDEISSLAISVIKKYLTSVSEDQNFKAEAITLIRSTINAIASKWSGSNSRLAASLTELANLFITEPREKIEDINMERKLSDGIIKHDLNQEEAQLYIQQHIINQIKERFDVYAKTMGNRPFATTHTTKKMKSEEIEKVLFNLRKDKKLINPESIMQVIENPFNSIRVCDEIPELYKKGEFSKAYEAIQDYLDQIRPDGTHGTLTPLGV